MGSLVLQTMGSYQSASVVEEEEQTGAAAYVTKQRYRGGTVTLILSHYSTHLIIIACGVIGRSVRDSWFLSHRQLHRTSSYGC